MTSVFVGGGTPSLVDPDGLLAVVEAVPLAPGAEVTVECNPDDLTVELAERYAAGGVTRLSIGVQSMVPEVLATLGREHDPANVERAVAAARRAGLDLNVDLVYGAAGETAEQWVATVAATVALAPDHVSAYALTVEAGTPLAADPARHPDDDTQADEYLHVTEALGAAGYEWYEISNWARPPGPRVPPQPPVLDRRRVPGGGMCRPRAPRRPPLLEPPHARALPGCDRGRPVARVGIRGARPPRTGRGGSPAGDPHPLRRAGR